MILLSSEFQLLRCIKIDIVCGTRYTCSHGLVGKAVRFVDADEIVSGFILELRRGTITLCVLSQLETPQYGYSLIDTLAERGLPVEANTIYPLLRRLEAQGMIGGVWNTASSKPRKYYTITPAGQTVLEQLASHWRSTVAAVSGILGEVPHA